MNKLAIAFLLSLSFFMITACDKDRDKALSLEQAESILFETGVDVTYTQNFSGYNDGRNGTCAELQDIRTRGVLRTDAGVTAAVNALKQYHRVLQVGAACLYSPEDVEELIYYTISRLENCRLSWRAGERCR